MLVFFIFMIYSKNLICRELITLNFFNASKLTDTKENPILIKNQNTKNNSKNTILSLVMFLKNLTKNNDENNGEIENKDYIIKNSTRSKLEENKTLNIFINETSINKVDSRKKYFLNELIKKNYISHWETDGKFNDFQHSNGLAFINFNQVLIINQILDSINMRNFLCSVLFYDGKYFDRRVEYIFLIEESDFKISEKGKFLSLNFNPLILNKKESYLFAQGDFQLLKNMNFKITIKSRLKDLISNKDDITMVFSISSIMGGNKNYTINEITTVNMILKPEENNTYRFLEFSMIAIIIAYLQMKYSIKMLFDFLNSPSKCKHLSLLSLKIDIIFKNYLAGSFLVIYFWEERNWLFFILLLIYSFIVFIEHKIALICIRAMNSELDSPIVNFKSVLSYYIPFFVLLMLLISYINVIFSSPILLYISLTIDWFIQIIFSMIKGTKPPQKWQYLLVNLIERSFYIVSIF